MAASVVEVLAATSPAATSVPVTITTALVPSDLVVLITPTQGSSQQFTPSGLGTWSADLGDANAASVLGIRVHLLTGVTGGGVVTLTQAGSVARDYVLLVMRGLAAPTIDTKQTLLAMNGTLADITLTALSRDPSAVAVTVGHWNTGTPTPLNPKTATPSTGWVSDRNTFGGTGISVSHNVLPSTGQVTAILNGSTSLDRWAGLYIFGASVEARLVQEYADVVLREPGQARLAQVYEEVVVREPGQARLMQTYLEVLTTPGGTTPPPPGMPVSGVANIASTAYALANPSILHAAQGRADIISGASGGVSKVMHVAGRADIVSTAHGEVDRQVETFPVSGVAAIHSTSRGLATVYVQKAIIDLCHDTVLMGIFDPTTLAAIFDPTELMFVDEDSVLLAQDDGVTLSVLEHELEAVTCL